MKQIKCIDNQDAFGGIKNQLTFGKVYDLLHEEKEVMPDYMGGKIVTWFRVIRDDTKLAGDYDSNRFEVL